MNHTVALEGAKIESIAGVYGDRDAGDLSLAVAAIRHPLLQGFWIDFCQHFAGVLKKNHGATEWKAPGWSQPGISELNAQ